MKHISSLLMVLCLSVATFAQALRPMNFDDVMALKTVSGATLAPDGKHVVYVVSYVDMKENERRSELWLVNVDSAKPRRFTTGRNDSAPQ